MCKEAIIFHRGFFCRLNAAVSFLLGAMTLQIFLAALLNSQYATQTSIIVSGVVFGASLVYIAFAVNTMLTKIIISDEGIIKKALFGTINMPIRDIKEISLLRKNARKLEITIYMASEKIVEIDAIKYKDSQLLVDFCAKFKG